MSGDLPAMAGRQSPVDIPPDAPVHRGGLELRYGPIPLVWGDNPAAVQIDDTTDSSALLEGVPHALLQFHFHCPGEHTFGGTRAPMELHLVHQSAEGAAAVVGVTFVEGRENPAIEAVVRALAGGAASESVDLRALVPPDLAYVAYDGSLTMPPFSEGVAWRVLVRANTLARAQLNALRERHDGNARPIQPMGTRAFL